MVPQWLEMGLGVKRALGILLQPLEKNKVQTKERDCCPLNTAAVVPRQRRSGGRQSRATIPFSSISRFS